MTEDLFCVRAVESYKEKVLNNISLVFEESTTYLFYSEFFH